MAKKNKKETEPVVRPQAEQRPNTVPVREGKPYALTGFRMQAIILALLGLVLYSNTFKHEYAFDDVMAIVDNEYVQQGLAGIPQILTTDAYQSYLEKKNGSNQLAGGRYRPLSLVTFAVEQQALGINTETDTKAKDAKLISDMHARHVVNVLLYILSVVVLLYFLRYVVLPGQPMVAFVAALLFTVHPIHTEVVANVKSRDEILSVLFISLTFIMAFRYREDKKMRDLVLAGIYFFLALLSKEYAIVLVVLLPLSFYMFRKEDSAKQSAKSFLPYLVPFALYMLMRMNAVTGPAEGAETNVMNNPYLYADLQQQLASKIMILLDYLRLLIFPRVLVADYSYHQIPYTTFANPQVWLSLLIHVGMIVAMYMLVVRRHVLGFAIAVYLGFLFLVSNFLVDIGAPMGERLVYHSSIGFAIVVAWLLCKGFEQVKQPAMSRAGLAGVLLLIVGLSSFKTISRNKDWKNEETLFLTDVKTSPNSVLVNNNAAASYMFIAKKGATTEEKNKWFGKAVEYFTKALEIFPNYYLAHMNRGLCYYNMGHPELALPDWDTVRLYSPNQANLARYLSIAGQYFFAQGMKYRSANMQDSAIIEFQKCAEATPQVPEAWYNLALQLYTANRQHEARLALESVLKFSPNYAEAQKLYAVVKDK